jgi:hypothetical protein
MTRMFSLGFLLLLNSCAAQQEPSTERGPSALPSDYFALQDQCNSSWNDLVLEWRANGGGVKGSLAETRESIMVDKRSRLADLVRQSWNAQALAEAESRSTIGHWPVTDDAFRRVSESVTFSSAFRIPTDCQSKAWLSSFLWDEIQLDGNQVRRLTETPSNINWESPEAQDWISYWLFVRIE